MILAQERFPRLEMDTQASMARMSLIAGCDFWRERDEERSRMAALKAIEEFASRIGSQIHTQREINTVTRAWNELEGSTWAA